jgi:hypothetical protein
MPRLKTPLQTIVLAVEKHTGLTAPCDPEALAAGLGIHLDDGAPEHACAVRVLQLDGQSLAHDSTVRALARALCGDRR